MLQIPCSAQIPLSAQIKPWKQNQLRWRLSHCILAKNKYLSYGWFLHDPSREMKLRDYGPFKDYTICRRPRPTQTSSERWAFWRLGDIQIKSIFSCTARSLHFWKTRKWTHWDAMKNKVISNTYKCPNKIPSLLIKIISNSIPLLIFTDYLMDYKNMQKGSLRDYQHQQQFLHTNEQT